MGLAALVPLACAGVLAARGAVAGDPPRANLIPVRYPEGAVHGFLELRTEGDKLIGHGDLLQKPTDSTVESRLILRFLDGSRFEETTVFTQRDYFRLRSYRLVQQGPAFEADLDASLGAGGAYRVTSRAHDDGETKRYQGTIDDFPADVSNGLPVILAKNLGKGARVEVHIVAFTPKPRLIGLEFEYGGADSIALGDHTEGVAHFVLSPQLGKIMGFFAKLLGKLPPDSHLWIVTEEVPAFVKFQGPLYLGPVWRLELAAPAWPGASRPR